MSDLSAGSTIAGCRIEGVAGRGGMGVVYRAMQLALGRPVAFKAIATDVAEDPDYRARFERESRLAASIDHPNIIPVYEAGEFGGTLYLIMRWVDGTDLRTLLRAAGRLDPPRAVRLLRPVAAALSAAHRNGLVHRDIKPANVLIARGDGEDEEHVYLTDFGIARRTSGESAMTRTGMFVGTIDYTAPERIEGGKGDAVSDVYSFGCMLFESVTGHIPFDRPTEVAKVFAHMNDPVPSARAEVPAVPEALDAIIAKAMAKDPEQRFQSAGKLMSALGDLLHEIQTEERQRVAVPEAATAATAAAEPAPSLASTVRAPAGEVRVHRPRRRRGLALLAGALLLLIAIAVVVLALGGGGNRTVLSISGAGLSAGPTADLGGRPADLAAGPGGNVWASLPTRGEIVRVGAASGRSQTFAVGGQPRAIAADPGGIWVSGSGAGALARFNLRTGNLEYTAQLSSPPSHVAVDPSDASVWTVDSRGAVTHLSPTGAVLGTLAHLNPAPRNVTAGEPNWLWAVDGGARGLVRIGNNTSPTAFDAGAAPVAVTLDQGVWTAHANGHVTRFDPRPNYLKVNTDVGIAPSLDAIAAVENGPTVWTISKQTKSLYRLSTAPGAPGTGQVTFGSAPVAVAARDGGAWVATEDGKVTEITG